MSQSPIQRYWSIIDRDAVSILLILSATIRIINLDINSFWQDEIYQMLIARQGLLRVIFPTTTDAGGAPLDYIVSHYAYKFLGTSEGMLRLPYVLWGVLGVYVLYHLGSYLFGRSVGVLAACLLAILPLHVQYSREARFYVLPTLLILLSVYTLVRAVEEDRRRWWILYVIVTVLALYSQLYTLFPVAICGFWMLLFNRKEKEKVLHFILACSSIAILYGPFLIHYLTAAPQKSSWESLPPNLIAVFVSLFFDGTLGQRFVGQDASPELTQMVFNTYKMVFFVGATIYGIFLFLALYIALRRRANRRNVTYLSLILLLLFGGMGTIIALDLRTGYPFSARQLVIFSPYSVLAIATACIQFFQSRRVPHLSQYTGTLLIAICFLVWIRPLTDLYFPLKVDFRGAARYLFQHVESHDVLISPVQEYFAYYYPELDARSAQSIPTNEADMDKLVRSHCNVWIVLFQSALATPPAVSREMDQRSQRKRSIYRPAEC